MHRLVYLFIAILFLTANVFAYESIDLLNKFNLASYFDDYLGFVYESHGCLHFTPSDIYLLAKTIPPGTELNILKYNYPFTPDKNVPFFADIATNDLKYFDRTKTVINVYPKQGILEIKVDNKPYAYVKTLAGPEYDFLMPYEIKKGQPIKWDFMLSGPTDPGKYYILRSTDHYISSAYYANTVVPFGAWIVKKNGKWLFEKNGKWYQLPQNIINDINQPYEKQIYNYYDISSNARRYAGHDFGKHVLLWTKDGKNHYPEMGYAAGELYYEQIVLVKDLVHILTSPGDDDFDSCIARNKNFSYFKQVSLEKNLDPRVLKALKEYEENRLPRNRLARAKALGLVYYDKLNSEVYKKQAYWYKKLKDDWQMWQDLRVQLRQDFAAMGILSLANRQNLLEQWMNDRLEFKVVSAPGQAKNVGELSFTQFFKPSEKPSIFDERERQEMLKVLTGSQSQEVEFYSVKALNDYNFGRLLNDILGNLYKSHGCMHVSPRNIYFLYKILPLKAQVKIHGYDEKLTEEQVKDVPYLADMVNFDDDLLGIREKLSVAGEVKISVYPQSGLWLIYLKKKPFAKLEVLGGPQAPMYLVQGRDEKGKPIFEDHLAYPTSSGNYYIFKKLTDYVSNIYYDTTVVSMGGAIKKENDEWVFQNKNNKWKPLPAKVLFDLNQVPEKQAYTYYDERVNASGEAIEYKWGSHPFGRFVVQTSEDMKTMSPELIHSSGDLIMEERQLINDIIKVLAAPFDDLDKCIKYSQNFDLYKVCYDYVNEPMREDLIQVKERATYKLYNNLPLTSAEVAVLPKDVVIADKLMKNKGKLTSEEINILISEGVASRQGTKLKINPEKLLGLQYDVYQYVVAIQKFAHHYAVLKENWDQLSDLRKALLKDFNNFVIKDPIVFNNFMRELMLERTSLRKLNQEQARDILIKRVDL